MPNVQGSSPKSIAANIRIERHAGKDEPQAVAIAERIADDNKKTHADAPTTQPPTCQVRNWVVFQPGYHKGTLYGLEACQRIAANFDLLKSRHDNHLVPTVKIGHDRQQRLAKSLGFLNKGKIVGCRCDRHGNISLDLDDLPTAVGAEINAGRLNSGSVELVPTLADPDDPAKDIPGPILTGVAVLGEEQPAVKGFRSPQAVFADGTPVPVSTDPAAWLLAEAEVQKQTATTALSDHVARFSWLGRDYSATSICFSEMHPMNELQAKLTSCGLTPEQVEICAKALGQQSDAPPGSGAPAAAAPPAAGPDKPGVPTAPMSSDAKPEDALMSACKYADDPKATPEQKLMGAMAKHFSATIKKFSDDNEEMKKRLGSAEKYAADEQEKKDKAEMAAFSAKVEEALKPVYRKLPPATIESVVKPQLLAYRTATFASETDRVKAFNDHLAGLLTLPDDPRLKDAASKPADGNPNGAPQWNTDLVKDIAATETMRRRAPNVAKQVLALSASK